MDIVLFIESLEAGGAQRQLCYLARHLVRQGYRVSIVVYYPHDFYVDEMLSDFSVQIHTVEWSGQVQRVWRFRKLLNEIRPSCVIAFLHVPCMLAELCRLLPGVRYKLIASERNTDILPLKFKDRLRLWMHRLSDRVVPNSHSQKQFLEQHAPWLSGKIEVITNGLDLNTFKPSEDGGEAAVNQNSIRLVTICRYAEQKNGLALIEGLAAYNKTRGDLPEITLDWYGEMSGYSGYMLDQLKMRIEELGIGQVFRLQDATNDVVSVYRSADAFCLTSRFEGCANVICEAIACGLPVIATPAGDNERMVIDDHNGIIVNGFNAEEIAEALERFATLSSKQLLTMRRNSRELAEKILGLDVFGQSWRELL